MFQILVAEDNQHSRNLMGEILTNAGYKVLFAKDGLEALEILDSHHVDLILLDIMMPGMDGYQLTESLRACNYTLPIFMVSAKYLPADKRHGFLAGTDDYMTKPIDEEEMLLRIRALLRRAQSVHTHKLTIGETVLDYDTLTVSRNDSHITLPQKEFYLLYLLLSYPGKIFTRIQLMDEIWGIDSESSDNTVPVHINRLRNRFVGQPDFEIQTIRGLGYKVVKKDGKQ